MKDTDMTTNLNMNFDKAVIIEPQEREWVASPLLGVERQMLEREDAESGHATSIVRFQPNSEFASHTHVGGEEFFVLDGIFSDEIGDFKKGMYVRNPVGSTHQPHSVEGTTIFVKLGQMDPADQEVVRIDTTKEAWHPGMVDGLSVMPLHSYGSENIALVKWQGGTLFNRHSHTGGEEIFVIEGTFEDEHGSYPQGTWLRNPPGSVHTPFSPEGCTIFVKTGHL